MSRPNPILFALYRHALRLYPSRLRLLYQDQMLQTVRDAHAERQHRPSLFWAQLFADLCISAVKEHILMTRDEAMRRPIFFHAITLCVVLTLMGGAAAITMQQLLRRGADQPQIQMAKNYASQIVVGKRLEDVLPPVHIDIARSLEPFAIYYNDQGEPVGATGHLDQSVPAPPAGVFSYLRTHPVDNFTWQPRPGLRIAAVAFHVNGPNPGFILVGRSLTLVQQQENALRRGTFITWFALMALLALGALFLNRAQARHTIAV
jgi:hypothetical protein